MSSGQAGVEWVPYGESATEALAAAIARAQGTDPLARVTVVVPTKVAGLVLRRRLAGRPGGMAAVQFEVLEQVAERLAAPALARTGSQPLLDGQHAVLVARAAREHPGALGHLVEAPATLQALTEAVSDLRAVPPDTREQAWAAMAAADGDRPGIRAALAAIARRHHDLMGAGHHDEHDLMRVAASAGPTRVADAVGAVVLHLPVRVTPARAAFVAHLAEHTSMTVVAGSTGDDDADEFTRATVVGLVSRPAAGARAGTEVDTAASDHPTTGDRSAPVDVVVAPDAEEEVRHVAREIAAAMHAGRDLSRMQVLWTRTEPYASLLLELLALHNLPHNGPSTTTLGHTIVGRTLLGLLAWHDDDHPRQGLLDLLGTIPARWDGRPAPTAVWTETAMQAGVIGGRVHWDQRLDGFAVSNRREADTAPAWLVRRLATKADHADSLRAFALDLIDGLATVHTSWAQWAGWAASVLDEVLGVGRSTWPDLDREAEGQVRQALGAMADLDRVHDPDTPVTRWQFVAHLQAVLQPTLGRIGAVGTGVRLGPLASAGHVDMDRTWVLGAVEGELPPRPGRRPFLDDDTVNGLQAANVRGLTTAGDRVNATRQSLARVLASSRATTLVVPRVDRREGRPARPGPWVLALLGACPRTLGQASPRTLGQDADAAQLDEDPNAGPVSVEDVLEPGARPDLPITHIPSAVDAVRGAETPGGPGEWRRRRLLAAVAAGTDAGSHPLAATIEGLAPAVKMLRGRGGPDFTPWDGNLTDATAVVQELAHQPQSPSMLANYAACPRSWLFAHALGIKQVQAPRLWHDVDALDRGNLVHATLQAWVQQVHGVGSEPGDPAGPADQAAGTGAEPIGDPNDAKLLQRVFDKLADELEATGRVSASSTFWQLERQRLVQLVHVWHQQHRELLADGWQPRAVEWAFGLEGEPPLEVSTAAGITFRLRGRVDRIDVDETGRVMVWDYKTGSSRKYKGLADDIALQGKELQLPAYALAAIQLTGASQVHVGYWHVHDDAPPSPVQVPVDDRARARITEVFDTVAVGVAAGMFAAQPGAEKMWPSMTWEHCRFCPFDRICPSHGQRGKAAERDWDGPQAAALLPLVESAVLEVQE